MHDKLFDYALIAFLVLVIAVAGFNLWLQRLLARRIAMLEGRAYKKWVEPPREHPADTYRRMREDPLIREALNFSITLDDIDPVAFDRLLYGTTFIDMSTGERVDPRDVNTVDAPTSANRNVVPTECHYCDFASSSPAAVVRHMSVAHFEDVLLELGKKLMEEN